jgi:hypothetical protein
MTATEPEAAAARYAAGRHLNDGATVAVCDLGGGTFDATVVRKRGSDRRSIDFEIRPPRGVPLERFPQVVPSDRLRVDTCVHGHPQRAAVLAGYPSGP